MSMKQVSAIVRQDSVERLEERLRGIRVPAMTSTGVRAFGGGASDIAHSATGKHVRVDVLAPDARVDEIIETIQEVAHFAQAAGEGYVVVLPVVRVLGISDVTALHTRGRCGKSPTARPPRRVSTSLARVLLTLAVLAVAGAYIAPSLHRFHFLAGAIVLVAASGILLAWPPLSPRRGRDASARHGFDPRTEPSEQRE